MSSCQKKIAPSLRAVAQIVFSIYFNLFQGQGGYYESISFA